MQMRRLMVLGLSGALALAGAAGCGDEDPQNSAAKRAAATATPEFTPDQTDPSEMKTVKPDGPYVGRWMAKLTRKQATDAGDVRSAGRYRLELRRDGTYTAFNDFTGEVAGRYSASAADADVLVFAEDGACKEGGVSGLGVYKARLDGNALRFENVVPETGGCTGRTQAFTYPVYKRG